MAGGCEYSVEVRSRFSLFWDDALKDEDPEKLISKIQNQKVEKSKKVHASQSARADIRVESPIEESREPLTLPDLTASQKSKGNKAPLVESEQAVFHMEENVDVEKSVMYNRGAGRPYVRGFRARGGGRQSVHDSNVDVNEPRESVMEPRGRGRFRSHGFTRGRGFSYSDHREFVPNEGRSRRTGDISQWEQGPLNDGDVLDVDAVNPEDAEPATSDDSPKKVEEVIEEVKSYTLEEYKAMRQQNKSSVVLSTKGTRKPNDGRDVFVDMVPHRKISEESDEEIEPHEKLTEVESPFEIDVIYTDRDRGRGGGRPPIRGFNRGRVFRPRSDRGTRGRGNFRGDGRGRGMIRGAHTESPAAAPFVYNDQEFPSLR